jgi:hypothetical protein
MQDLIPLHVNFQCSRLLHRSSATLHISIFFKFVYVYTEKVADVDMQVSRYVRMDGRAGGGPHVDKCHYSIVLVLYLQRLLLHIINELKYKPFYRYKFVAGSLFKYLFLLIDTFYKPMQVSCFPDRDCSR